MDNQNVTPAIEVHYSESFPCAIFMDDTQIGAAYDDPNIAIRSCEQLNAEHPEKPYRVCRLP